MLLLLVSCIFFNFVIKGFVFGEKTILKLGVFMVMCLLRSDSEGVFFFSFVDEVGVGF